MGALWTLLRTLLALLMSLGMLAENYKVITWGIVAEEYCGLSDTINIYHPYCEDY